VFLCKEKDEKEENMKKGLFWVILLIVSLMLPGLTLAQDDVKKHASCKYCGMNRAQFAHSRVFIEYEDGTTEGTCSIHCAAVDLRSTLIKYQRQSLSEITTRSSSSRSRRPAGSSAATSRAS